MNFKTYTLYPITIFSFFVLLGACGTKDNEEKDPVASVEKQKVVKKVSVLAPAKKSNALEKWDTPKGDMNLINEEQSVEGEESSIGMGVVGTTTQTIIAPNTEPSVSISPSVPALTQPSADLDPR